MSPQKADVIDDGITKDIQIKETNYRDPNRNIETTPLTESTDEEKKKEDEAAATSRDETQKVKYEVGDHVYTWVSYMGIPYATQQHGIVVMVEQQPDVVVLVLFQKMEQKEYNDDNVGKSRETAASDDDDASFCMVRKKISLKEAERNWHKIPYGVHWTKRILTRAGTANGVEADDVSIAQNRISFLWDHQTNLFQNITKKTASTHEKDIGECIAVWCKTGTFYSFHGLAKMGHHGADMGSSATLAGSVCTQVVASALVPVIMPVFAVYDVAVAVKSWRDSHACQKEWNVISQDWNEKFVSAMRRRREYFMHHQRFLVGRESNSVVKSNLPISPGS
mmetsp:Transcript_12436/g.18157  ORF Transcript_12436/g.18157 Transcript_12436/m.18157 type:complete len:336 (-) Transcript_12436:39-1046(-)